MRLTDIGLNLSADPIHFESLDTFTPGLSHSVSSSSHALFGRRRAWKFCVVAVV